MPFHKIWSSRVNVGSVAEFVGEHGKLFYDEDERIFRLSDGKTPGGIPLGSFFDGTPAPDKDSGLRVLQRVYPLSGKEFQISFSSERIESLLFFLVIDDSGEEISTYTKKTDTSLLIRSNIELDKHFLFITYV